MAELDGRRISSGRIAVMDTSVAFGHRDPAMLSALGGVRIG
jgi:hypothetical protein